MSEISPRERGKVGELLANVSLYTASPAARDKIRQNCDGCERSQQSKVCLRGPLPIGPCVPPSENEAEEE